jgi:hypothetical protein
MTEKERMDGKDETGLEDKTGGKRPDSDGKERMDGKDETGLEDKTGGKRRDSDGKGENGRKR